MLNPPHLQPDQTFQIGQIRCTITKIETFNGEPHYGFMFIKSSGPHELTQYGWGWMPVHFVDNFTGHEVPKIALDQKR